MVEYGIFSDISNSKGNFSKSEVKISHCILDDPEWVVNSSIGELAERCGVSNATISRFCKKLGLESYQAFRLELMRSLTNIHADAGTEDIWVDENTDWADMMVKLGKYYTQAITRTIESLDKVALAECCQRIMDAETVYLVGTGDMHTVAEAAFIQFLGVSDKFRCCSDICIVKATAHNLSKTSVLILFAYTGELSSVLQIAKMAKEQNAYVVAVTSFRDCTLSVIADAVLLCNIQKAGYQFSTVPILAAFRYVADLLYVGYRQKMMNQKNEPKGPGTSG